jgi:Amt family ammonium transporter
VETNVYWLWLLSMASLIFLMQAGFFLLEGGQVRSRDVNNVLMKMTSHLGVGAIVFLIFGFALKQFGWPFHPLPEGWRLPWQFVASGEQNVAFFVSVCFCLVSCAIPSGSFSGRMRFPAYLLFAAIYTGLIYPLFAFILWNGYLAKLGVQDYAGSLGVHAVGGVVGLVGARYLGARSPRASGHNVPMMGLGALLLMFSWFGFNLGSVPSYGHIATDLPLVATNTLAAIAGGIVGALAITLARGGKGDAVITPNGGLAGAVAICSGVHLLHPLYAVLVGVAAGAQIPFTSAWIKRRLKIDDPCDVGPVHATPGLMGGIATGLWAPVIMAHGGFHGYTVSMAVQIVATLAALGYALLAGTLAFKFIGLVTNIRVSSIDEVNGLDLSEHGAAAYPELEATNMRPLHVLSGIRVAEVMVEPPRVTLATSVAEAEALMLRTETFAVPVIDDAESNQLCGIITISDVAGVHPAERLSTPVRNVCSRQLELAFPDQSVHEVVERMHDRRLANFPVVSRNDEQRLLGLVTKADIVQAYRRIAVEGLVT